MIAILSRNINSTMEWIAKEYDVRIVNRALKQVTLVNGRQLQIISTVDDAIGLEFTSIRKAPDYDFLEEFVKTRIKIGKE